MAQLVLFLGAGASEPFGIPTMRTLTDEVLKEIPEDKDPIDYMELCNQLGMTPDIETILSLIDALSDPEKAIKDAGPFTAYLGSLGKYKTTKGRDYKEMATKIRESIRKKCFLPDDEKKLVEIYDQIFSVLNCDCSNPIEVFTTNYDYCFEKYCKLKGEGYTFSDGFGLSGGDHIFTGNWDKSWKIYKLHGASNYVKTSDGSIIQTTTPLKLGTKTKAGEIVEETMVYPTTDKYISIDPFFTMLHELRDKLKNIKQKYCVILGYSFRDNAINNAFYDAAKTNKNKIILIDKKAQEIADKFKSRLNIYPINGKIQDYSTINQLKDIIGPKIESIE